MIKLKPALILTLLTTFVVLIVNFVLGSLTGYVEWDAFLYILIMGGGRYIIPFFIITFLYLQLSELLRNRFSKMQTLKSRLLYSLVMLITGAALGYLWSLLSLWKITYSNAIWLLKRKDKFIYIIYFIIMVLINETRIYLKNKNVPINKS